ncbi:MAG TPA: phage/plasmid primase, P4 family [Bryobacteraceae bacterium]|jgi:putative DNA primase/helicase
MSPEIKAAASTTWTISPKEQQLKPNGAEASQPLTPRFDSKTRRLLCPVPTIGDTLLHEYKFASNEGEKLHLFVNGRYCDHGLELIRQKGQALMRGWSVPGQWKKGLADEVHEWVILQQPKLWERPPLDRINLCNGIFNLATNQLEPHTPGWLSPVQLPILYDPGADCPAWDEYLEAALSADVYREQVTFQMAALLMIPYTGAQKALLLQGPRGTGKSRYLAAMRAFLGPENTSSKSLHALEENRFACPYLYGKLANICPDLPSRHLETVSVFKAITGEDFIDAEYKHGKQFQFRPFSRLLFSANQPPQSSDATDASLDRWWVIPFTRRFQDSAQQISAEELDRRLSKPSELSGVLNRALRWVPVVQQQKGIAQTTVMKQAHDEFCAAADPFRVWLAEFVGDDPDGFEACDDVQSSYFQFRRERGLTAVTVTAFGLELRRHKRGLDKKQRTVEHRHGTYSLAWCYIGIRLKKQGRT